MDNKKQTMMTEIGVEGAKISNGFVHEEFLRQLIGDRGRRVYREMRDNDATVSAIMFAVEMLLRSVKWTVETDGEGSEAETSVEFVEGVFFEDMSHTWEDFIANTLSMLTFGWQYTEIVFKRRVGPSETDPSRKSNFSDGKIGIRKLADRSQETLDRWEIEEDGSIRGMWQSPPNGGAAVFIPIEKALLFRPHLHKGSPEGRSVLRGAYRSWYFLKNIEEVEAIAIERELNGLPVVYIPNAMLTSKTPEDMAAVAKYTKLVRDIKYNEQGGAVLPSDPWFDPDGKPGSSKQVELVLLSSSGKRAVDTDSTIKRYQANIARTIMADFIMLGHSERGGFALSKNKTDLFAKALEGWLSAIEAILNRHLIPKLWTVNGFNRDYLPRLKPGRVAPEAIQEVADFISKLSQAGATIFPDDDLENRLREMAGLPEKPVSDRLPPSASDMVDLPGDGLE